MQETQHEVDQDNVGVTVVLGWNHWGKGKTLAEAKKAWKSQSPRNLLSDGYTVLEFDEVTEFTGVDQMGYVHWRTTDGSKPRDHAPKSHDVAARGGR